MGEFRFELKLQISKTLSKSKALLKIKLQFMNLKRKDSLSLLKTKVDLFIEYLKNRWQQIPRIVCTNCQTGIVLIDDELSYPEDKI